MKKNKTTRIRITKGEKLLHSLAILCFLFTVVLKIFCGANISSLSMTTEKIRKEITDQQRKNESLVMKVNELTSYANIKDIVADMGLAYNNENIVVIDE